MRRDHENGAHCGEEEWWASAGCVGCMRCVFKGETAPPPPVKRARWLERARAKDLTAW